MAHSLHATYLQNALCFTIIKMPWLIEYCKSWGEDFKKIRDHLVMGSHQLQHQCVLRPASSFCLYRILTIHTHSLESDVTCQSPQSHLCGAYTAVHVPRST